MTDPGRAKRFFLWLAAACFFAPIVAAFLVWLVAFHLGPTLGPVARSVPPSIGKDVAGFLICVWPTHVVWLFVAWHVERRGLREGLLQAASWILGGVGVVFSPMAFLMLMACGPEENRPGRMESLIIVFSGPALIVSGLLLHFRRALFPYSIGRPA